MTMSLPMSRRASAGADNHAARDHDSIRTTDDAEPVQGAQDATAAAQVPNPGPPIDQALTDADRWFRLDPNT
jgi:hypothetical protein